MLAEDRVALAGHPHVGVGGRLALLQQVALLDQAGDRGELLVVPAHGGLGPGQRPALGEHQPGRPGLHHLGQPRVLLRVAQQSACVRPSCPAAPAASAAGAAPGRTGRSGRARRRARPASAPAARRPRSCPAPARGTPTPGGGRRARSTSRRPGRRRSAAVAPRAGPPRRCAPSAAGCRRCAGGTWGRSRAPCRPSRRCGRSGSPGRPASTSLTRPSASTTSWNDSALRSSLSLPSTRAASPASTCWRRARRKSCSASARGEPVSRSTAGTDAGERGGRSDLDHAVRNHCRMIVESLKTSTPSSRAKISSRSLLRGAKASIVVAARALQRRRGAGAERAATEVRAGGRTGRGGAAAQAFDSTARLSHAPSSDGGTARPCVLITTSPATAGTAAGSPDRFARTVSVVPPCVRS